MTHFDLKPSVLIDHLRSCFRDIVRPGRAVSVVEVVDLQRQINGCYTLAVELEEEFAILSDIPTPLRPEPSIEFGNVIPLRRRPRLHVVATGGPDGGDAA